MNITSEERTKLYKFVHGKVHNDADADDIVQQAVLNALATSSTFRGESSLSTWLSSIALRIIYNTSASATTKRTVYGLDPDWYPCQEAGPEDQLEAKQEEIKKKQDVEKLFAVLSSLPPTTREALTLVVVNGMSYAQAAEVMHVPENTVKSRIFRGRASMRKAWLH